MKLTLETKLEVLYKLSFYRNSYEAVSKELGLSFQQVKNQITFRNDLKQQIACYDKIITGGLPGIIWPELYPVKSEMSERDMKKRIGFLEAKLAYYEELARQEGIDLEAVSKKNALKQSENRTEEEKDQ